MYKHTHFSLIIAVLVCCTPLASCVSQADQYGSPSPTCGAIRNPVESIKCLNDEMFPDSSVPGGVLIGAASGAVLGGVVAFATKGRNTATLGRAIATGGIVGGVAGGVAAYISDLRARAGGDNVRAANMNAANIDSFNRQLKILNSKLDYLTDTKLPQSQLEIINAITPKIEDTTKAYIESFNQLTKTQYSFEQLTTMTQENNSLLNRIYKLLLSKEPGQ